MTQIVNLHAVPELQEVRIKGDLRLRPLNNSDAKDILKILNSDGSIRDMVSVASRLDTEKDITKEIETIDKDSGLIRYTLLKGSKPIGLVSLWRDEGYFGTTPQSDDYGFGYFLDPGERGKGFVTSAIRSLMETITKILTVRQFVAFCEDTNSKSIAVLTKLGFEPTDETFREPIHGWTERKYIKSIIVR